MPIPIVTSIISAISIIAGSLIGAYCSWIISKNMHVKEIEDQHKILKENRCYEEKYRVKEVCNNANVIRLDIATSLFQSIRSLQNNDEDKKYLYLLPINKNYSEAVASLSDEYSLQELSLLYQLYGIIEKVNRDIYSWNSTDNNTYERVRKEFSSILYKIYGNNVEKILKVDADKISYKELYNNQYIRSSYKNLLEKLDELCLVENLLKKSNEN